MKRSSPQRLRGSFQHLVYSPRGEIEGVLLQAGGAPVQLVFDRHDPAAGELFAHLHEGQAVVVEAEPAAASPKGEGVHAVYDCGRLVEVDGEVPAAPADEAVTGYRGQVLRFNYARHGAINGVVLDTGDFLHLKPHGHAQLQLQLRIGDHVEADGDAQPLADGRGWAVEASVVNGHPVKRH